MDVDSLLWVDLDSGQAGWRGEGLLHDSRALARRTDGSIPYPPQASGFRVSARVLGICLGLCCASAGPALMATYGVSTEAKIAEVVEALELFGSRSIIALEGVPGTGKSFIGLIAAQRFTGQPE